MAQTLIKARSIPEGNQLRVYLFIVLGFAILFALITPPNQVPDEGDHFFRSYEVSKGQFIPNRHPNLIPVGFDEIQELKAIESLSGRLELIGKKFDYQDTKEYATHSTYPILIYLPQGLGIAVGRLLHLPLGVIYVLGRLFNALVYVGVLFLSLRIMPSKRWLLLLLFSTPMAIYEAGSFSPDALTNALGLFFISLVLAVSKSETPFTKKQYLGLFFATWLLSQGKVNLAPLAMLLLMVPWQRFGGILRKLLFLGLCLSALLVSVAAWDHVSPNQPWALAPGSNPTAQLLYVVLYPFTFLRTLFDTLAGRWVVVLNSWFGVFGWFDTFVPELILAIYLAILVFLAAVPDEEFPLSAWKKWVSGITWFVCIAVTAMLLYLVWTPYQAESIEGMQGRYLVSFAPLIFLLLPDFLKPYPNLKRYQGLVATVASSLILLIATTILILRFYIPCGSSYYSLTACFLPAEDWKGDAIRLEPIVEGTVIEQVIIPECDQLNRVKLLADTFDRFNHSFLEVAVIDKETQVEIDRETIDNTHLSEDPRVFVQFDPVANSRGRTYIVKVTSDAIPDTAVTLNRSEGDQYLPGQLLINGEAQDGDLIFEYGCKVGIN